MVNKTGTKRSNVKGRSFKQRSRSRKSRTRGVAGPSNRRNKGGKRLRSRTRQLNLDLSTADDIDFTKFSEPENMTDINFSYYIKKVLKKVKPNLAINRESTNIVDRIMKETLHQLATYASAKMGNRRVLVPKVIMKGMRQILPLSFRMRADERAQKALNKYKKSKKRRKRRS